MDPPPRPTASNSLFEVYLRLRPPFFSTSVSNSLYPTLPNPERFLTVEPTEAAEPPETLPTHITIHPPSDSRKRAVEKFAFTKVFEEQTPQLDLFCGVGATSLVEGVLKDGRDGLIATLGVTGSGKSHTILGSKTQRGLTQLSMELLFRTLDSKMVHPAQSPSLISSLVMVDASEAQIISAGGFLDGVYGDVTANSRAATPMAVGKDNISSSAHQMYHGGLWNQWSVLGLSRGLSPPEMKESKAEAGGRSLSRSASEKDKRTLAMTSFENLPPRLAFWSPQRMTRTKAKLRFGNILQDSSFTPSTPRRNLPQRPSALPRLPDIRNIVVSCSKNMEFTVLVSMYEVYNDRIFDLLTHTRNTKDLRRRPLLFKSTERSPDRKVVAGLRKVVCGSYEEALMVLETGLMERRVAGTGSNSVSSRSHGFFCLEVKKRPRGGMAGAWNGCQLTIVDLAGSERARNAKTAGTTLAEAGKINESLMYLGQCLQIQSDSGDGTKPSIVPFRQCKLTELLFSNSFPSHNAHSSHVRNPQKAVMIVTADPVGDFNATSQILRYSALAREVTVPRIPSVASIVFQNGIPTCSSNKSSGRSSPDAQHLFGLEAEISRLGDQVEILAMTLAEERARRREAEQGWKRAEERAQMLEAEVREECFSEMESRIELERRRWMHAFGEEADRTDAHIDRKLEILSRGIQIYEDPDSAVTGPGTATVSALESENASLRTQLHKLSRELQTRSPTKPSSSLHRPSPSYQTSSPTRTLLINDGPPKLSLHFPALVEDDLEDPFGCEGAEEEEELKHAVGSNKENENATPAAAAVDDVAGHKLQAMGLGGSGGSPQKASQPERAASSRTPGRKMRVLTPRLGVGMGADEEGEVGGLMGTP